MQDNHLIVQLLYTASCFLSEGDLVKCHEKFNFQILTMQLCCLNSFAVCKLSMGN